MPAGMRHRLFHTQHPHLSCFRRIPLRPPRRICQGDRFHQGVRHVFPSPCPAVLLPRPPFPDSMSIQSLHDLSFCP
jgi:hypothetical protein